ncbi:hypothetical protein OsJ_31607 [Oryza sativa Japonica Group]|uniref:Uncharacterized protein n=4 Tax=Oryza TaxID=4527 RepID=A3C4Z6_ORYSJ|nr:hypothetical protein OsJ_31607 [Oryza sativa Japonica Group]
MGAPDPPPPPHLAAVAAMDHAGGELRRLRPSHRGGRRYKEKKASPPPSLPTAGFAAGGLQRRRGPKIGEPPIPRFPRIGVSTGPKIGEPPIPRFPRIGVSTGIAWFGGKFVYYTALRAGAEFILKRGEERMKMELANIILNKHSDEKTLVEAVKENFFAEHLFSDQYQDRQLFRWHLRNTYVDSAFMERVKEIEVKNSDDGSGSISGHRTTNTRSFGDLMEDPLACILGSSDSNIQSNKSAEHTGTTVKRRESLVAVTWDKKTKIALNIVKEVTWDKKTKIALNIVKEDLHMGRYPSGPRCFRPNLWPAEHRNMGLSAHFAAPTPIPNYPSSSCDLRRFSSPPFRTPRKAKGGERERGGDETAAMVMQQVQVLKEVSALLRGKETPVILDLEESLRAKGDMTQGEEVKIYASKVTAVLCKAFATATSALVGYHVLGVGAKLLGNPPLPRIPRIGMAAGSAWIVGKFAYYTALQASPIFILEGGEERMKMELANIILTKHNDEKTLVEAVKQHFFAEHLFSDQYQDMPLFRWRLRHTYVDSTFMERVKEIEVKNSSNGSGSISGHRTTNTRSFGDLMEDPLACILGSPDGDIENKKSAENTGTIVKRREDYPSDFQSQATDRSRFSGMNISVHEQNEFHRDV